LGVVRASNPRRQTPGAPNPRTATRRTAAPAVRARALKVVAGAAVVVAAGLALGLAFSGSPATLAPGVEIDGIDVGGLTPSAAEALLTRRFSRVEHKPVIFTANKHSFTIRPDELSVQPKWSEAIAAAGAKGDGIDVIRGFRRLALRFSTTNFVPRARSYQAAVDYEVGLIAEKVDKPDRDARLVRHGASVTVRPGQVGNVLDRTAAAATIVAALSSLSRHGPVALPTSIAEPSVTTADLRQSRTQAARALSAPVTLLYGSHRFQLLPRQLGPMLQFPGSSDGQLVIGGEAADAYFKNLDRKVGQPAHGAGWAADGDHISVVPAEPGIGLDVPLSAAAVLAAAERSTHRTAKLVVSTVSVGRTTAEAEAMGITGVVGSYETFYGGIANRIHNVELVSHLINGKLIAPGATFSFNQATGARTAAKGFLEAPVIINGELSTGLGGGVCQVSTTVFNAAFVAGLPITARTNHALYISHYPLGRDATVDYPDVDLKFVNDTPHWLLLRTFVGPSSLVVTLYGAPQHRRVVSDATPLTVTAPAPIVKKLDPSLAPGTSVVEEYGQPATTTSVRRLVYDADGKLLSDATWYSNYQSTPTLVEVGPKPVPKPKQKQKPPKATTPVAPAPDLGARAAR
jgi:vancomycin resistance protein YoaR